MMKKVTFHHAGQTTSIIVHAGESILTAARQAGVILDSPCNGNGTCGKCKVKVSVLDEQPETVLACNTNVQNDVTVEIIERQDNGNLQIKHEGLASIVEIDGVINKKYIAETGRTNVYRNEQFIASEQGDTEQDSYGLAIDIGTTTLVVALIHLLTGQELAVAGALNPQSRLAQDVLSRIRYASNEQGLFEMNQLLIEELNQMIAQVTIEAGISSNHIYELVLSGNTCMLHLATNTNPVTLGKYPYTPVIRGGNALSASDLGFSLAGIAQAYLPPIISAYVGGDITSGILVSRLSKSEGTSLFIDIGTNGEIVLAANGKLVATSTAAGPAFEGMNISCGMRAAPGAVEGFDLTSEGESIVKSIADQVPVGICGSGLLDIVAAMVRRRIIGKNGKFNKNITGQLSTFLTNVNGKMVFSVAEGVFLSQPDVRQVQLAKGAIRGGIEALLDYQGLVAAEVDRVLIAGSFGYHLNPESLIEIGLLPEAFRGKIEFLGNTSKSGSQELLLNQTSRLESRKIVEYIAVLELATIDNFDRLFVKCLDFTMVS
ncbi:ASKHA domain-containing protein [Pelosinus sp. UFO1]|uniref:ASKHA domain-containing protein n=1 Tax=Pelosinus sp. UFO1 TaxID=484770 RepID=UPI0004D17D99|nr:ASKHA domain-containing protein [Pelosinus sp. UFO1]AIF52429.1 ferredoxin [Pelosinus sp. UFO1]